LDKFIKERREQRAKALADVVRGFEMKVGAIDLNRPRHLGEPPTRAG
jgi:hypothetical protein